MKKQVTEPLPLLVFLKNMFHDSSSTTLRSWIQEGRILVDGRRIRRTDYLLEIGQIVTVGPKLQFLANDVRILFEDRQVIVLEKPEGLLSVATDRGIEENLHSLLKRARSRQRVYPVHRLDKETSGVIIFTYSKMAQEHLKRQFAERKVHKMYYALVQGAFALDKGTWRSFLEEDDFYYVKSSCAGKEAITQYERIEARKSCSLLRLYPKTGRKNQIRVHCKEAGFPVIGDRKYGGASLCKRLCLHAQEIRFQHPQSEKLLTFSAPLPEIFYKLLAISKVP